MLALTSSGLEAAGGRAGEAPSSAALLLLLSSRVALAMSDICFRIFGEMMTSGVSGVPVDEHSSSLMVMIGVGGGAGVSSTSPSRILLRCSPHR